MGHHQQKWGEEEEEEEEVYRTLVAPCSVLDSAVFFKELREVVRMTANTRNQKQ